MPNELLHQFTETLERIGVPYMVVGSVASGAYGTYRQTNDIDVVVRLEERHIQPILRAFPEPDFYCSEEAIRQAIREQFQFNILHLASGFKIDVIIATDSEFDQSQFARRRIVPTDGKEVCFASPEDVILKKLEYFQEGGSEKHPRDIISVLETQGTLIDRVYLQEWVTKLGLQAEWNRVLAIEAEL